MPHPSRETQIFNKVFEDSDVLVVEKCQAFDSQRGDEGDREGFYEFVSRHIGIELYPVHRLDREVLGLMIFGKTQEAADHLSAQFRERKIHKAYIAEVYGRVFKETETLLHYLKKNPKTNYVTVFPRPTEGAKQAELTYWVYERLVSTTRLIVKLMTGRSHQIRAQLAKVGHAIVGDGRYGKQDMEGSIRLRSVLLGFRHPRTGTLQFAHLLSKEEELFVRSKKMFEGF